MPKSKLPKKKPTRTAAEQAVIDKRMATMRAARAAKAPKVETVSSVKPEDVEAARAAHDKGNEDIVDKVRAAGKPLKGISLKPRGDAGKTWRPPEPPKEVPQLKEWRIATLADLANLPRMHIPMFMQLLKQTLHRLGGKEAITEIAFNEHNKFAVKTIPIDEDVFA